MVTEFARPLSAEPLQVFKPEVVILSSSELVDRYAFSVVQEQILSNKHSVLTLPTGFSPQGIYRLMVEAYRSGLDMGSLVTTNLDEYWPLPKNHSQSYDHFMRESLFDYINIPESQRHIPSSAAEDPEKEAARYQSVLEQVGAADLAILGIGPGLPCHIGFNERGSTLDSRVRLVQVDPETVRANARFFGGDERQVPHQAITQGITDILEAKKIILIAKGCGKAKGIQRALDGPVNSDAPASFLRLHPNVTFIIDQEAGSLFNKSI